MGYKIDSAWAKFCEEDIKKLNNIIDDEYCQQLEIRHKISIMEKFEKAFWEEVSKIRFDIIRKFMLDNDWKWIHYKGSKAFYAVPTKEHVIDVLKNDYLKHGLYEIIELGKTSFCMSGGGIMFSMNIYGNECYVDIGFDIAHFIMDK